MQARLKLLSRRDLLGALAAGTPLMFAACSENQETGRSQLMLVSDEQLAGLADGAWRDLLAKTPAVADPAMQARLRKVGAAVAAATGRTGVDWDFQVLDRPEVNAFVLPNGKVGAFRGLMEFARSDDELGGVIGHEAGHIVARHAAERVSQELAVQLAVGLAQAALSEEYGENAGDIAAALGMGAVFGVILPYSRRHELEADALGVRLMRQAGLDPRGAVRFFERLAASRPSTPRGLEILSTHPADGPRIEALRRLVEGQET